MKITQKLPQFKDKKALIIVTGRHTAEFYIAGNGKIIRKLGFRIDNPKYRDNEGFFTRTSQERTLGSGSIREINKPQLIKDFLKKVKIKTKSLALKEKPDQFIIFTPSYLSADVKKTLENLTNAKMKMINGNYHKEHPFNLLKKI